MAVNSKQKGARFERQLAAKLREYGFADSRRTAQYCGNTGDASDVIGLPGIHIEAKHQEQMRLYEWIEQAKRDCAGTGNLPAVFHRKNNAEILVSMTLDDWMTMYRAYLAEAIQMNAMTDELGDLDYVYGHPEYGLEPLYVAEKVWEIIEKYTQGGSD